MLNEGDMAPAVDLPLHDGRRFSLAAERGRVVVLYFYPKDDTSGCTREAIDFSALQPEFDRLGVRVVGISPDSVDKHEKFRRKHDLTVPLAADEDTAVAEAYGVWREKTLYGRTYMGIVRSTFLIDATGRLNRIWNKVSVAGHAEEVLDAARALAANG